MRFWGEVQGLQVNVLVDSGSSHSFLSSSLLQYLSGVQQLKQKTLVKVANGETLSCDAVMPQEPWTLQGCTFYSDLGILPLSCYDMIVGMDWLELHSPMKVHWKDK